MKSKDQTLLEEAYAQVLNLGPSSKSAKPITLDQDEQGPFRVSTSSEGKPVKNRLYHFYDSEGNQLDNKAPLKDGQIMNRTTEPGAYLQVKKEGDQFIAVPFTPSKEVADHIKQQIKSRVDKGKEQAMSHFFPKK